MAVIADPRLIILDEPSLGLAPLAYGRVKEEILRLTESGVSLLLVEQNIRAALQIVDYGYVLSQGAITAEDCQMISGKARPYETSACDAPKNSQPRDQPVKRGGKPVTRSIQKSQRHQTKAPAWVTRGTTVGLLLLAAGCGSSSKTSAPTTTSGPSSAPSSGSVALSGAPVKIGLIAPLTGPLETYGEGSVNGLKVWTNTVGAQQGVDGRPVKVYTVDEGTTPATGAAAARELVSDGVELVIGPISSNVAPAVLPVLTRAGIVDMSNLTFAPAAQPSVFPYTFVLTLNQSDDAITQQRYACKIRCNQDRLRRAQQRTGAGLEPTRPRPDAPCHLDVVATEPFDRALPTCRLRSTPPNRREHN